MAQDHLSMALELLAQQKLREERRRLRRLAKQRHEKEEQQRGDTLAGSTQREGQADGEQVNEEPPAPRYVKRPWA
eukprot:CAMPEP_0172664182 /NCGR_PEP_ID=MMETSP1074-20121228/6421_1 /TAXON_ID=2916 /ORGANISM="Ceratium fusus, Strain PA161109" /LENGTH=74 /DNA_ID=CAMNT_0013480287 /DNA_START=61 /DNA_END=285 /DNA_ORIENTATION=+